MLDLELIHIGFSTKSRGVNGHFKIKIEDKYKVDLKKARALFLNLNGSKVPFLIEEVQDLGQFVIKLEEIETPEEVTSLLSKEFYLDKKEVSIESFAENKAHELVGYSLFDQNENLVGEISDLEEYPNQLMATVTTNSKQVLIPIHNDLIISTDTEKKSITLTIVEGLLDL